MTVDVSKDGLHFLLRFRELISIGNGMHCK